jgi:dTDP-4-amino-4,6-dideoxygalactose transaminase
MTDIEAIAGAHGLTIVEDAAQALGASIGERPVGTGTAACFSFYATKNVTTGEGGAVTTDDDTVAAALRTFRDQGQRETYDYARPGLNLRMTELEAALGVAQMGRLGGILAARRAHATQLTGLLEGIPGLVLPAEPRGRRHVFHQYTVRVTRRARLSRDELSASLRTAGIDSRVYYPRTVFDYDCFRADPRVEDAAVPNARRASLEVLSLPVHPRLDDADLHHIGTQIREALC